MLESMEKGTEVIPAEPSAEKDADGKITEAQSEKDPVVI